jgi:hypothetical protein
MSAHLLMMIYQPTRSFFYGSINGKNGVERMIDCLKEDHKLLTVGTPTVGIPKMESMTGSVVVVSTIPV